MIWMISTYSPSSSSSATVWATSRSKCPSTRSEEHTSELQSLMRISYAVFCLKKKKVKTTTKNHDTNYAVNTTPVIYLHITTSTTQYSNKQSKHPIAHTQAQLPNVTN